MLVRTSLTIPDTVLSVALQSDSGRGHTHGCGHMEQGLRLVCLMHEDTFGGDALGATCYLHYTKARRPLTHSSPETNYHRMLAYQCYSVRNYCRCLGSKRSFEFRYLARNADKICVSVGGSVSNAFEWLGNL